MIKFDMFSGEPSYDGSPPMSEPEIVQNANLMYDYDPQQRLSHMQQQPVYPGGFNTAPGYNQFSNFMNPPVPPGTVMGSGFSGFAGNPAYQFLGQGGMQNPYINQQPQDYTYFVPGFNTGSNTLLPADAEAICDELQMQMMIELEEANMKRIEKQKSYYNSLGYNNGYNYYGMPYMNSFYADPQIVNKYKKKIEDIKREAEEKRSNMNKNLSRLCQNYLEGEVDEKRIEQIYSGRTITIPGQKIQYNQQINMFASMVPVDTSRIYQQHNAQVSAEFSKYFDENTDMNSFLRDCGQIISADRLDEEMHKRRDGSNLYKQDGAYTALIKQKLREKHNAERGGGENLPNLGQQNNQIPLGGAFPTLQQSSVLLDDGTLQISAPSWLGNKQYQIKNVMEDEYEKNRGLFLQSIYRDNPKPGGDPNGS